MNQLNPSQVEQLKEIGAYLRQLRQEQSISTEEIATKTFIPLRLLKALEEGESNQLPEPIFIQGFIRRYADALDLDGSAIAKTFPATLLPIKYDTSSQEVFKTQSTSIHLYIAYILLLVAATSGLFYLLNKQQATHPHLQRKKFSFVQQQQTVAKPAPSIAATAKNSLPSSPIQVTLSFKDESWLRVIVDGKTQFEGILTKGIEKTWTANKQLTIRVGSAGAVLASFNKQEPKLLGSLSEVKEVTFTPNN